MLEKIESTGLAKSPFDKKGVVLKFAAQVFLEKGYAGASINEMCRRARISKETVYRHFKNKEALFAAVIDHELEGFWAALNPLNFEYADMAMEQVLVKAGIKMMLQLASPQTLALRRTIFHDSAYRPEIGHLYYSHGPEKTYQQLTHYFDTQKNKGYQSSFDSSKLSEYYLAMLLHKTTLRQLCSMEEDVAELETQGIVEQIVSDFIRAFFQGATS